jgi:hypothetical protein
VAAGLPVIVLDERNAPEKLADRPDFAWIERGKSDFWPEPGSWPIAAKNCSTSIRPAVGVMSLARCIPAVDENESAEHSSGGCEPDRSSS